LSSVEEARHFDQLAAASGRKLRVHLAVDTGMGRGGFPEDGLDGLMDLLGSMKHLEIEGIGSHLPSAEEDEEFTQNQIDRYHRILDRLGGASKFRWRHLLNSAGLLGYDPQLCNLSRPGLMLYGVSPLPQHQHRLRPVMSLKSRVTLVRTLPAGHGVSYGRQFVTTRPTRVATIGIGYGDGYPRHLSGNGARVRIGMHDCPVIGRVTMDQIMTDVTEAGDVVEGDEVELFGTKIPIEEVARKAGTISWEIFTGITPRVVRCYSGAEC
jgi:alanine racemase